MVKSGIFIVIEGTDGSGKTEQFNRLYKKIKRHGFVCERTDFPQYLKPSSYFIKRYLNGDYGGWQEVSPYQASIFYALDRFEASAKIKKWLNQGKIVLSNRYVASNLGHQGVKIKNKKERRKFFYWLNDFEYHILKVSKPDINIFLHMPSSFAYKLIGRKEKREYLKGKKRDIHEQDIKHLKEAEKVYLEVSRLLKKDFVTVECAKEGKILSKKEIEAKIWTVVKKFLW